MLSALPVTVAYRMSAGDRDDGADEWRAMNAANAALLLDEGVGGAQLLRARDADREESSDAEMAAAAEAAAAAEEEEEEEGEAATTQAAMDAAIAAQELPLLAATEPSDGPAAGGMTESLMAEAEPRPKSRRRLWTSVIKCRSAVHECE
jgi:hypothetical protein